MAQPLRIALGADHGGVDLKQQLVVYLRGQGHEIRDCGTNSAEAVDYPVFAEVVGRQVGSGDCDFGIVVDGAGIGSAMAANKVPNVLAAACYNEALAKNSREHNGANVLTLGSGQVTADQAKAIVDVFLTTACSAKRHQRRVEMIRDIEIGVINRNTLAERTVRYRERWRYDEAAKTWWLVTGLPDLWAD